MSEYLQNSVVRSMLALAIAVLTLSGCNGIRQQSSQGYVEAEPLKDQIQVGSTTKNQVQRLLGSPSTVSAFPPETWYYISRDRETVAFLEPELKNQKVTRIEFDAGGVVSALDKLDKTSARDIEFVERETPTEGRSLGLLEQLLGNIGKFNTPRDATQARQ